MSTHLADDATRWRPTTEQQLRAAIDEGVLSETHYLDAKREVGATAGARKETARDLASFAIDGGALLVGVDEDREAGSWGLAPQPLAGLAERVEQIATQVVDPPLFVYTTGIPSTADPTLGYLMVHVPASTRAPHLVDNIYYGRGDKTRIRVSDAEVLRHHTRRESVDATAIRLLDEEVARDPAGPDAVHQCGRLYGVAQPLTAPRDAGRALLEKPSSVALGVLRGVDRRVPSDLRPASPSLDDLGHYSRRSQGLAWTSYTSNGPGRTLLSICDGGEVDEDSMLDVELWEDGGRRLLVGRVTTTFGNQQAAIVFDALPVVYALRLAMWAAAIGEESAYHGEWLLGVHVTDLRGLRSYKFLQTFGSGRVDRFDAADYREVTTATHLELAQAPGHVAERLVGRLARALGTAHHYDAAFAVASTRKRSLARTPRSSALRFALGVGKRRRRNNLCWCKIPSLIATPSRPTARVCSLRTTRVDEASAGYATSVTANEP